MKSNYAIRTIAIDTVVKIGNQSLDRVFELFRLNFSNKKDSEFLYDIEGLTKVKDFLRIELKKEVGDSFKLSEYVNKLIK